MEIYNFISRDWDSYYWFCRHCHKILGIGQFYYWLITREVLVLFFLIILHYIVVSYKHSNVPIKVFQYMYAHSRLCLKYPTFVKTISPCYQAKRGTFKRIRIDRINLYHKITRKEFRTKKKLVQYNVVNQASILFNGKDVRMLTSWYI